MSVTRHMFDFPNNDGATPLCHNLLTGGAVVRQVIANVNCQACIDLWQRAQDKPDPFALVFDRKVTVTDAFQSIDEVVMQYKAKSVSADQAMSSISAIIEAYEIGAES